MVIELTFLKAQANWLAINFIARFTASVRQRTETMPGDLYSSAAAMRTT
jgi:hypothetical protein